MAKASMAKARPKPLLMAGAGSSKCQCNPGYLLVALILLTLGIYVMVAAFGWQFNSPSRLGDGAAGLVLASYFIGLLLLVFGKMAKWKSHEDCKVHS